VSRRLPATRPHAVLCCPPVAPLPLRTWTKREPPDCQSTATSPVRPSAILVDSVGQSAESEGQKGHGS
jgi:hypothetical protein